MHWAVGIAIDYRYHAPWLPAYETPEMVVLTENPQVPSLLRLDGFHTHAHSAATVLTLSLD